LNNRCVGVTGQRFKKQGVAILRKKKGGAKTNVGRYERRKF